MKAAANGALNCSVLDGWWVEGCDVDTGWAIGNGDAFKDDEEQDRVDAESLFHLLEGEIVIVEPALDFVGGTPVVVIWVDLPDTPEVAVLPGMTVEAEVVADEALGALLVPIQALHELDAGSHAVFVVQEDGTLLLTPVTPGLRDYANVQILSGLQAGDVVSTGTVETR